MYTCLSVYPLMCKPLLKDSLHIPFTLWHSQFGVNCNQDMRYLFAHHLNQVFLAYLINNHTKSECKKDVITCRSLCFRNASLHTQLLRLLNSDRLIINWLSEIQSDVEFDLEIKTYFLRPFLRVSLWMQLCLLDREINAFNNEHWKNVYD